MVASHLNDMFSHFQSREFKGVNHPEFKGWSGKFLPIKNRREIGGVGINL